MSCSEVTGELAKHPVWLLFRDRRGRKARTVVCVLIIVPVSHNSNTPAPAIHTLESYIVK